MKCWKQVRTLVACIIAFAVTPVLSEEVAELSANESAYLHVLEQGCATPGWIGIHAAEDLIVLGHLSVVHNVFSPQGSSKEPSLRIGIWRVLARCEPLASVRQTYVDRIRAVLLDVSAPDRLHALEALAKLNVPFASLEEQKIVRSMADDPADAPFALWRLKQNGDPAAVERLIACLHGSDATERLRAAYVLSKMPDTAGAACNAIANARTSEPKTSPAYPAIAAAAGGNTARALIDDSLPSARYVGAMWLADHGTAADRSIAHHLASDDDVDVRVAGAFASLMIEQRWAATTRK